MCNFLVAFLWASGGPGGGPGGPGGGPYPVQGARRPSWVGPKGDIDTTLRDFGLLHIFFQIFGGFL